MATGRGLGIVTDGLVFYYDTGNSIDSYLGEPTTNLVGNPTFIGTSGTQTQGVSPANWVFSGYSGDTGFKFYNSSTSPIPLKFPNEGAVITTGPNDTENRRIYFRRTDLLPNTTYSISCWMYFGRSFSNAWSRFQYDSNGSYTGGEYFDNFATYASANGYGLNEWFLWQGTLTTDATTAQCYWGPVISKGVDILVGMQRMQVEVKPHITPFVNGTRSTTGSLLDISGQEVEIDLANVSFDSNAQMTFDGTDDYAETVYLSDIVGASPTAISFELIVKANGLTTYSGMMGDYVGPSGTGFGIKKASLTDDRFEFRPYAVGAIHRTNASIEVGKYYHLVCTWSNTGTLQMFVNGVLDTSASNVGTTWNHGLGVLRIGDCYGGMGIPAEFNGDIPLAKIYNKALTAAEVKRNYNAIKTRFGL